MKKSILLMMAMVACNAQALKFVNVSSKYDFLIATETSGFYKTGQQLSGFLNEINITQGQAPKIVAKPRSGGAALKLSGGETEWIIPNDLLMKAQGGKSIYLDAGSVVFLKPGKTRIGAMVFPTIRTSSDK